MKQITAGELAKRVGITSRTVRYYDSKGLLKPDERSPLGYRLYDKKSVIRLQQIIVLKFLGLSLDEISSVLSQTEQSAYSEIIDQQLISLRNRQEQLSKAIDILAGVTSDTPENDIDQLFEIMRRLNIVLNNSTDK